MNRGGSTLAPSFVSYVVSWLCHMPSVCDWALVALPSIAACLALQKRSPYGSIATNHSAAECPLCAAPRGGEGMESRDSITATQRHTLIFLSLRNWKSVTQLLRNAQNRRWVLPLHVTLIPLQSGSKRAIALASPATLISLQSAPDSGGARQHHSPMQDR